jgi:undecaprenyl-diphosphatase
MVDPSGADLPATGQHRTERGNGTSASGPSRPAPAPTTRLPLASLACATAFVVLTALVVTSSAALTGFDHRWSEGFFTFTSTHGWAQSLARLFTLMGDARVIITVTAAAVIWCALRRSWWLAGWLVAVAVGSELLSVLVKNTVQRARPPSDGVLALAHGYSFPSGHTQASTVTYVAVVLVVGWQLLRPGPVARRTSAVLVVALVGAVGLSRIMLGVHWPTDVLGGWLLGSAWVTGATYVLIRYVPPRLPRPAAPDGSLEGGGAPVEQIDGSPT